IASYRTVLLPFYSKIKKKYNKKVVCQGDNARCHQSKLCKEWIFKKKINHAQYGGHPTNYKGGVPANSPDLNPLEYVFSILQQRVSKRSPKTIHQMINIANDEWKKISQEIIQKGWKHQIKVINWIKENKYESYLY